MWKDGQSARDRPDTTEADVKIMPAGARQRRTLRNAQPPRAVVPRASLDRAQVVTRHRFGRMCWPVLARGPLPYVAGHVEQSEPVGSEEADGTRKVESFGREVVPRDSLTLELVAPWEQAAVESATGGVLPFRLGRQASAHPPAIRLGLCPFHVHDRMRGVRVPLRLTRHLQLSRSRKGAEIAGRHLAVEHLVRFADVYLDAR